MGKSRKTGRELEPARIQKGTPLARKFFAKLGITSARYDRQQSEDEDD
ncbi:hypothetical protein NGM10_07115 [Halorussus salilacus]|nr:hypothetical protein [Halorussus salilacus]USZ69497.1 hypothetical protein NGM10_07115 [Halorussus salilacus]